jgi:hypothetical protein
MDEMKTSPTTPAVAAPVVAHYIPGVVAAGVGGLEKGRGDVGDGSIAPIITQSPRDVSEIPFAAKPSDGASVADEMEICKPCGFMARFGRGPIKWIVCRICQIERGEVERE